MGQNQSKELNKFQLSILSKKDNKYINTNAYKITNALNVYYVYFKINDISLNHIINNNVEIYISNQFDVSSNFKNEDILKTNISNNTKLNIINKKRYYDIEHTTNNSNKLIFRSLNVIQKTFDVIYII